MMEALYMVAKKPTIGNVPNREALFEPIGKVAIGGVCQTSNMKPTYNECRRHKRSPISPLSNGPELPRFAERQHLARKFQLPPR